MIYLNPNYEYASGRKKPQTRLLMIADIFIKLKKLRESLGLKQTDVAECTSMTQRDISLLENGHKEFIPTSYIVFLTQLGIDVRWIFNGRSFEEDTAYLREFKKRLSIKNLDGTDLLNLYRRKAAEGKEAKVAQAIVPLSEVYVIRAEAISEYVKNQASKPFLEQQGRIQLPMEEAYHDTFRCFQVESDRMVPNLQAGDYLIARLISADDFVNYEGSLFVVVGKSLFIGRLSAHSDSMWVVNFDNPAYPSRKIPKNEITELWTVRWRLTRQVATDTPFLGEIQKRLEDLEKRLAP